MHRHPAILAMVALSIGLSACGAASQERASGAGTLEAQEYLEIRQLIEG